MGKPFTFRGRFYNLTAGSDISDELLKALTALDTKVLAFQPPLLSGISTFTLGGVSSGILTSSSMYPLGNRLIAVGSSSSVELGYIAADEPSFTVAGVLSPGISTVIDDDSNLLNRVDIFITGDLQAPETGGGERIFGILQTVTGTLDGSDITDPGVENLQISFVYVDSITNVLTATTLPAATYDFIPVRQQHLTTIPIGILLAISAANLPINISGGSSASAADMAYVTSMIGV